jgi:hypothetical protein
VATLAQRAKAMKKKKCSAPWVGDVPTGRVVPVDMPGNWRQFREEFYAHTAGGPDRDLDKDSPLKAKSRRQILDESEAVSSTVASRASTPVVESSAPVSGARTVRGLPKGADPGVSAGDKGRKRVSSVVDGTPSKRARLGSPFPEPGPVRGMHRSYSEEERRLDEVEARERLQAERDGFEIDTGGADPPRRDNPVRDMTMAPVVRRIEPQLRASALRNTVTASPERVLRNRTIPPSQP